MVMQERIVAAVTLNGEGIGIVRILQNGVGEGYALIDNNGELPDYRLGGSLLFCALECLGDTNTAQLIAGALDQLNDDTRRAEKEKTSKSNGTFEEAPF